jgi:hypothetical protein
MGKDVKPDNPAATPDPAHDAPPGSIRTSAIIRPHVRPQLEPPHAGAKGQREPRARARVNEHGRGRNPK